MQMKLFTIPFNSEQPERVEKINIIIRPNNYHHHHPFQSCVEGDEGEREKCNFRKRLSLSMSLSDNNIAER